MGSAPRAAGSPSDLSNKAACSRALELELAPLAQRRGALANTLARQLPLRQARRMCGRDRNRMTFTDLKALAPLPLVRPQPHAAPNMDPNEDIRPTPAQWIIRPCEGGAEAARLRWWLVPFFHKGKPLKAWKAATFNARAETVATSACFKGAFTRRRCLVPASGWDEWTGEKGEKQRWTFTARDGEPLTFAGLWDRCETADEGMLKSFTVVTQPAGSPLNGYHDRAPVVIWRGDRERWLTAGEDVSDLIGPESPDLFNIQPAA